MTRKINSKINFQFSIFNFHSIFKLKILNLKFPIFIILFIILFYTRFINIGWGLPYAMHPDERNMANALQNLKCEFSIFNFQFSNLKECFNPHFFAYGQLPLYLGYILVFFLKFFDGDLGYPISFQEAAISLRIISALASMVNVFVLIKIVRYISNIKNQSASWRTKPQIKNQKLLIILITIFSPFFIQFSHFGTTESLLMLSYSLIVYYSLKALDSHLRGNDIFYLSLFSGLAVATKISSIIFFTVPLATILSYPRPWIRYKNIVKFCLLTVIFAIIFSPHNLINYRDFISALRYESAVATGQLKVFYTRQFEGTMPYLFQSIKIFPYALGWPIYALSLLGFIFLSWKDKYLNLIRLAILIYFIPSGYIFAKWSRFMAPILPLMLVFALLTILKIKDQISKLQIKNQKFYILLCHFAFCILIFTLIFPGISYLSVYQKPDVRFRATDWINKNIPANSYVLSETANVVDIPLINEKNLNVISFDFYNLDESPLLQKELQNHLENANYIFMPSRRIFANHPKEKYPLLNDYYEKLFSGKLGFGKMAEFSSRLDDESAEETWSIFDHPVIRIYKRN